MSDRDNLVEARPLIRPRESRWAGSLLPAAAPDQAQVTYGSVLQWLRPPSSTEVFLQIWKLGDSPAGAAYGENVQRWRPMAGLGIVPGDRPPQRLTEAIAMDIAAAGLAGEEPPLASYPVAHISGGSEAAAHAVATLFGTGMVVQMWFPEAGTGWAKQTQVVYRPRITDPLFQRERFYAPLLTPAIAGQASDDDLDRWLFGATAYLREAPGEKGVLLLRRREP